jgi:hypothetical protein
MSDKRTGSGGGGSRVSVSFTVAEHLVKLEIKGQGTLQDQNGGLVKHCECAPSQLITVLGSVCAVEQDIAAAVGDACVVHGRVVVLLLLLLLLAPGWVHGRVCR